MGFLDVRALAALAALLLAPPPAGAQLAQNRVRLISLPIAGKVQVVIPADVDGDGRRDLLVARTALDVTPPLRALSVFLQKPEGFATAPDQSWALHPRAAALFHGDLTEAPGLEIGYLCADGAYVYEREGNRYRPRPRKLLHHPTFFDTPSPDSIVDWGGGADVDGNGFDDLFLPGERGVQLYFQNERRRFGAICDLPVEPERGASVEIVAALEAIPGVTALTVSSAVTLPTVTDINGDGLADILFLQGDRLVYFLQGPPGRFPAKPSDAMQVPVLREYARKDRLEASYAQVVDINRDRRADLVVTKRYGNLGDFGSVETDVYVFLARPPATGDSRPNRCYNFDQPDQQLRLQGFSPQDPEFADANGDGFLDVVLSQVTTEMWGKLIQAAMLREVRVQYNLHLFEPDRGQFAQNPDWSRSAVIPTSNIDGGGAAWPFGYLRGDFDGKGNLDFLEISGKRELTAHLGRPVFGAFGGRWEFGKDDYFRFELEDAPQKLLVEDLNGDKRADVILIYDDKILVVLSQ